MVDEIAAKGNCVDFVDVQFFAKGHGFDWEISQLFVSKAIREEVNARCERARQGRPSGPRVFSANES